LLNDDDQYEPLAGPQHADVEAAGIKHDMQTTNDDLVGQLTAENVRHTSSTEYTYYLHLPVVDVDDIAMSLLTCLHCCYHYIQPI